MPVHIFNIYAVYSHTDIFRVDHHFILVIGCENLQQDGHIWEMSVTIKFNKQTLSIVFKVMSYKVQKIFFHHLPTLSDKFLICELKRGKYNITILLVYFSFDTNCLISSGAFQIKSRPQAGGESSESVLNVYILRDAINTCTKKM